MAVESQVPVVGACSNSCANWRRMLSSMRPFMGRSSNPRVREKST